MQVTVKTVKYAVATFLAIFIAQWLQLDYAVSAGIIAVLSLAETNKATIVYIGNLTLTMVMSLIIASLVFQILGYHIWTFALFLAIAYPISVFLKSSQAIAPCAVSVSHLFLEQTTEFSWLMNEMMLLVIGAGIAMLINLYQPSVAPKMAKIQLSVEESLKNILNGFAAMLTAPDQFNDNITEQIDSVELEIAAGLDLANKERANQFNTETIYYAEYFEMRLEQVNVLYEMESGLRNLKSSTAQNKALAEFLEHVADELHEKNTARQLQREIESLTSDYRHSELPTSREEFESRAILFELLTDSRKFLKIKNDFYERLRLVRRHSKNI